MHTFKDQIVVVTGSTRGFGLHIAEAFLRAGATVVVSGRSPQALQQTVETLRPLGPVDGIACDVADEAQVHRLAAQVIERHGRIDVWINNAGYSWAAGAILDFPPVEALKMFQANDLGTLHGAQAALAHMLPRGTGLLINLYGAGSFLDPARATGLYGATKAWVTSFTRTLASEIKDSGVRLIGFAPGMMLTEMLTRPQVIGERGREMMESYGFVLRFLGRPPQVSARALVKAAARARKPFTEVRLTNTFKIIAGLLRVLWENLTRSGKTPEFTLEHVPAYTYEEPK